MRVLCVDAKDRPDSFPSPTNWDIVEGFVYTVMEEEVNGGVLYYYLYEDPDGEDYGYNSDRFIPLSNIDEIEIAYKREQDVLIKLTNK